MSVALVPPTDKEVITGAPGATAVIVKVLVTGAAAPYVAFPLFEATIEHIPGPTGVTRPLFNVQIDELVAVE